MTTPRPHRERCQNKVLDQCPRPPHPCLQAGLMRRVGTNVPSPSPTPVGSLRFCHFLLMAWATGPGIWLARPPHPGPGEDLQRLQGHGHLAQCRPPQRGRPTQQGQSGDGRVCVRGVRVPARVIGLCECASLCVFSFLGVIHSVWGGTHEKRGLPACGALRCGG